MVENIDIIIIIIYIYSVVDIHKLKLDCESIGHREQLMMIVLVGTII